MTAKGPIRADDLFQITGRGQIFTTTPDGIPDGERIDVGDTVHFVSTNPDVVDHSFFHETYRYEVRGIETLRTLMYPPSVKGIGFLVRKIEPEEDNHG